MASQAPDVFIGWINACNVLETPIATPEDLSDGMALGVILHHFLPDRFGEPDASLDATMRLGTICTELDMHLDGKLTNIISADVNAVGGDHTALILCIVEALVVAAVNGPRNQDAVAAILSLGDAGAGVIGSLLQQHMEPEAGNASSMPEEEPAPRPRQISINSSDGSGEFAGLHAELQELRNQLEAADIQIAAATKNEQIAYEQLTDVRFHASEAEQLAFDNSSRLAIYKKQHADDLKRHNKHIVALRHELEEMVDSSNAAPSQHAKLEQHYRKEMEEVEALRKETGKMESELEDAMTVDVHVGDSIKKEIAQRNAELKRATGDVQGMMEEESTLQKMAAAMLESLFETEDVTNQRDAECRRLRNDISMLDNEVRDKNGLVDYKENELYQVVTDLERQEKAEEDNLAKQIGRKAQTGAKVVTTAAKILTLHYELSDAYEKQMQLEDMKRKIVSRDEKLEVRLSQLETDLKDPIMINKMRIMAEDMAMNEMAFSSSVQQRKDNEQTRLSQESSELQRITSALKAEEDAAAKFIAQTEAEQALAEKDQHDGRRRLEEAEAKLETELLQDKKIVEENLQREQQMLDEAKQQALKAASSENSDQQAAAEAAAVAKVEAEQAEAKAMLAAEHKAADEEGNKEVLEDMKNELLLREKMLHNLKKQSDDRKAALRKEARLMLAVHHMLSMRYHQLYSHYNALSEDLDRRCPPPL